ncbi:cytochrome P460 family protein [Candidatus Sulfurimonas marisnigri]|uniref:Cytochrome P460 family protein n=1 Tax=Candidatus Sulfurimonas marisnigri TaxID=2740405 RepID=A0A7S7M343_9BACT|nr:cytochrome P460 family protein [Candidatus Sulfurimonas marisnigri]QOY55669.1 cytochrome P460 family protein [Candidatus Sulfurimonas marisnigri]
MNSKLLLISLLFTLLYSKHEDGASAEKFVFPKWKSMNLLNKELLNSIDHNSFVDIYVNDIAKSAYINKNNKLPEGSIILKPLYPERKRENLARLVIMMKMKDGYDSENENWWYGVYDKTGTNGWFEGKIDSCINCHEHMWSTDYLFSESVINKINTQ